MSWAAVAGVLFFVFAAMLARQLPIFKGGFSISLEWCVYLGAAICLPPSAAALVPLVTVLGLQAVQARQRRWQKEGLSLPLLWAAFRGGVLAAGAALAAAWFRLAGGMAPAAGWDRSGEISAVAGPWLGLWSVPLIGWVACCFLPALLQALGGALWYQVGVVGELVREVREHWPEWLIALPGGIIVGLAYMRFGHGPVLVSTLALLSILVLYTLLVFADMQGAYWATVHALVHTMEWKDQGSPGETGRGACLAAALGRKMHLAGRRVYAIYLAGLLRDIGLVGLGERGTVNPSLSWRGDGPGAAEHAVIGGKILEPLPRLKEVSQAVRHHHERWDGSGGPEGRRGKAIPLEARIVALVDTYIALTSDRPFRSALSRDQAWERLQADAGKAFDPALVPLFREVIQEEEAWGRDVFKRHHTVFPVG